MQFKRYAAYAWGVLIYNLGVILWGAYVRATGSGAGCGSHWPLCNGEVIPRAGQIETMVEFTHRLSSGLALILVIVLLVGAFRGYGRGHPVRLGAGLSMFFMVTEALVGAGLVLLELVGQNDSISRAIWMAAHLVNTFLLLAAITLTAWWASGGRPIRLKGQGNVAVSLGIGLLAMMFLGASGAITALGDTLYPASSLAEGIRQDFSPTAHFLLRLRVFHPLIAIVVGLYLILAARMATSHDESPAGKRLTQALLSLFLVQLGVGALNVRLLAPIWLQLVHLLLADLVWIVLVLLFASTLVREKVLVGSVELPAGLSTAGLDKQGS
jgi:heme A synthase